LQPTGKTFRSRMNGDRHGYDDPQRAGDDRKGSACAGSVALPGT
jgi:hypothetical protein